MSGTYKPNVTKFLDSLTDEQLAFMHFVATEDPIQFGDKLISWVVNKQWTEDQHKAILDRRSENTLAE